MKLRSRERSPLAGFRAAGRTTDRPLLAILSRLQQRYGRAFASEGGLRRMIYEDTGLMPGVGTLVRAIHRLADLGLVVNVWLRAGQELPDGNIAAHGTRLVWVPKARRQRRAAKQYNAKQDRRAGYQTRLTGHGAAELVKKLSGAIASAPPAPRESDLIERERARQLRALADLEAAWQKPPDG